MLKITITATVSVVGEGGTSANQMVVNFKFLPPSFSTHKKKKSNIVKLEINVVTFESD